MSWNPQWDARQPLQSAPSGLGRQVGVLIGQPFHHVGLNATYVDISRETPRLNTDTWGNCYPAVETEQHAREAFEKTIADLDKVIGELTDHRTRLAAALTDLPGRDFATAPPLRELPMSMATPSPAGVVDVHLPFDLPASPDSTPKG